MMHRRDDLIFRQEMKFRYKLVEYLTDWIMGNSHQVNIQGDICSMSRYQSNGFCKFFTSYCLFPSLFPLLAHLSMECSVSYCDHSPSVGVRPSDVCPSDVRLSVQNLLVNTPASTNIDQSSPNLVKIYMTTRVRMSSIMELIGLELSELSAFELENLPYLTMFIL